MVSTVFFLRHHNETKRAEVDFLTFASVADTFRQKFGGFPGVPACQNDGVSFHLIDSPFHECVIDDFSEIMGGSLVEARLIGQASGLQQAQEKLAELERAAAASRMQVKAGVPGMYAIDPRQFEEPPDFKHIVRIRGLPWDADSQAVATFFGGLSVAQFGVMITLNQKSRATGEAYVAFTEADDVERALGPDFNRRNMATRYIEVMRSTPEDFAASLERQRELLLGDLQPVPVDPSSSVVRMRGIPFQCASAQIKKFFSAESFHCVAVHMSKDRGGRPSGEAFVEFKTAEEARDALILSNPSDRKYIGNRYIELFESDVDDLKRSMGVAEKQEAAQDCCVSMRGLPYQSNEADITAFFQEAQVTPVRIHRKADGGDAFVEFQTAADAHRAMSRDKAHIGRRYIELQRVSYNHMARTVGLPFKPGTPAAAEAQNGNGAHTNGNGSGRNSPRNQRGHGFGRGGYHPHPQQQVGVVRAQQSSPTHNQFVPMPQLHDTSQHPPPQYPNQQGYPGQQPNVAFNPFSHRAPGSTLRMFGIPWSATHQEVLGFFAGFGVIPHLIDISKDPGPNGRPNGEAWVQFTSIEEAQRAFMARNGQYLANRWVKLVVVE